MHEQGTPRRGRFITVEGGEGVGKSFFMTGLRQAIAASGSILVATREPGGTPTAECIRALFSKAPADDPLLAETEALLVSAARAQHVGRLIEPTLRSGRWVLSDRYHDSMRVYQGALGGVDSLFLEQLIAGSTKGIDPDVTFLLDLDVEIAQQRLGQRNNRNNVAAKDAISRYDEAKPGVHETLRRAFLELAERWPQRIIRLDAMLSPEVLVATAMHHLRERFGEELALGDGA